MASARRAAKVVFYDIPSKGILEHVRSAWEVVTIPRATGDDELASMAVGAVALVAAPSATADLATISRILRHCDSLKLFQCTLTGVEHVDWDAVPPSAQVCNVFDMEVGIAEFVLAALLQWNLRLSEASANFGQLWNTWGSAGCPWMRESPFATLRPELGAQTIGIIGLGHIGSAIAVRAAAFGTRVIAVRSQAQTPPPAGIDWVRSTADGLDALLAEADFVVVCCALTAETKGLIDAAELAKMRSTAVLVNVARGPIVIEQDLFEACQKKSIGGGILDVWWSYAKPEEPASKFPFHELSNVIISPHASGWTTGFRERRAKAMAANLDAIAHDGTLRNRVSRPRGAGASAAKPPKRARMSLL